MRVGAVIAAAGLSSRMKAFKPLLPLLGSTFIGRSINSLKASGVSPIIVVTGHCADQLEEYLQTFGVACLLNVDYAQTDMYHSVCLGLAYIQDDADYVFILPADVPLFSDKTLSILMESAGREGPDVVLPIHNGMPGHPVLVRSRAIPALLEYQGQNGLKGALRAYNGDKRTIEVSDVGITLDADTGWDYALFQLLTDAAAEEHIHEHAALVARLAVSLGRRLNRAGFTLNLQRIELAALLHDIARQQPHHAEAGARLLDEIGQPEMAEIIRRHMKLLPGQQETISEITVVYLADKYAQGSAAVTLEQRFRKKRQQLLDQPEALAGLEENYRVALHLERMMEHATGAPIKPDELLTEAGG